MIENLHFSLLKAEELDAATARILTLIDNAIPSDSLLGQIIPIVVKDRAALQLALTNARGSAHTARIAEADAARDDAFIAFRTHCESATRRRTRPDLVAAGELILRHIRTAGYSLQTFGHTQETGALNALVTALFENQSQTAISTLGAGELLTELTEAQAAFEVALQIRNDEQAAENYPALAAARKVLGNRLQLLLGLIDALNEGDTNNARPELDTLIQQINEAVILILAPARARRTRAANESAPDETPPTPAG